MRARPHDYDDVQRALVALAASGGSPTKASQALKAQGFDVPKQTLHHWRNKHADRYQELQERYRDQIEQHLIRSQRELAVNAHDVAMLAVEKTRDKLEADEIKDPATTARNLEVVAGTAIDKVLILEGRPTQITQHREPTELIDRLKSKGINVTVEPKQLPKPSSTQAHKP